MLSARAVAHTDPKLGSAGGTLIANFLARPEFAGIKKIVLLGNGATSVARGDADIAIETMGTLLPTYGVDFVGLVPASLNAHLYFPSAFWPRHRRRTKRWPSRNMSRGLRRRRRGKRGGRAVKNLKREIFVFGAVFLSLSYSLADAQVTFVTPSNEAIREPRPLRDRGPALAPAILAAQTAVNACETKGYKVSAVVVDSAATPVVVLSGDGAALITQSIAMGKAVSSAKNAMSTRDLAKAAQGDPALAAKLAADPEEGPRRAGGLPIKVGADVIGAIAVSGTPNPDIDATCAQAGLERWPAQDETALRSVGINGAYRPLSFLFGAEADFKSSFVKTTIDNHQKSPGKGLRVRRRSKRLAK